MADRLTLPTTQRAYTLRLRGINASDRSWLDALWATHEVVNKGAKVFGNWLLTLRGGLNHTLEDTRVKTKGKPDRDPTPEERKNRRILLALSWLSVEDAHGAPRDEALIVAKGTDSTDARERKLADALAAILQARGVEVTELQFWLNDCLPSLAARIRDDADGAVWVNRSQAFDAAVEQVGQTLTREIVWDMLEPFFGSIEAYLAPMAAEEDSDGGSASAEEKAKDLVQKAGHWLSSRFGTGTGANFERMASVYHAMANWAKEQREFSSGGEALTALTGALASYEPPSADAAGILKLISGPGYKSATRNTISNWMERAGAVTPEDVQKLADSAADDADKCHSNVGGKGRRPYADAILEGAEQACGATYLQQDGPARHQEFSVMLDHAARRVSIAHSWIKRAEAERRQFESDARRLQNVPSDTLQWLREYCKDRTGTSGALQEYLIRKRAIDGWDKLVDRWCRADCQTPDDRVAAARQLQDDPDLDKFGDIQLFEALAAEDARCVWKPGGTPTAQPLKDFVAASEAEAKKKRFKVPAYRHPDPLRHPIFTDFGNSRWNIDFSAHRAPGKVADMKQRVQKLKIALADADRKLASATEKQREPRQSKASECRDKLHRAEVEFAELREAHRLNMGLWNGQTVTSVPLHWSCKRLVADLALHSSLNGAREGVPGVSRADRLGRAAANADHATAVTITDLFEQDYWNGRLQAPRAQLDAIARHVEKHGWDARARTLIARIRWLVTFSAQLTPQGPWTELATRLNLKPDPQYWPHAEANKKRKGHAKLLLSRLPGLRVLSVDLGHRYAAACAVWEALALETMKTEIHGRTIVAGGSAPHDLYCHTLHTDSRGKERTTIYRRIGPDVLPDNTSHAAPWARLDRQFLIKLQGEDRPARKASPNEIEAVEQFELWAGRIRSDDNLPRELAVDALMSDVVRTARLALARHARRAKIAHQLTATVRTLPGARLQELDEAGRLELLLDTLADWCALATDSRWSDESARQLWNHWLSDLAGGFTIEPPPLSPGQLQQELAKAQRREAEQALRSKLQPLAQTLAGNGSLRRELHQAWCARWNADDDQWKQKLKWLSGWLMPRQLSRVIEVTKQDGRRVKRRKPIREAVAAASNVGGLSLTRISTLTEFRRKVQVGYFTRMWPDGSRAEIGLGFGKSTLDTLERMKNQRIKQLASRIVEAALGIGIDQDPVWDELKKKWREHKRPHQRSSDPRFAPCHAVIIEDLSHYRPEETRTRRENRATMDWKSAETRKRLEDHCQLYGLHLRDVNPQYTSRQDSRTGAPGVRCVDIPVVDFLTKPWWRKQVTRAEKKAQDNKGDARDRFLLALQEKWSQASDEENRRAAPVRITLDGGEIFVSADPRSPLAGGIQADLNAAANIGLRAFMDPDFPGRWWYVPCDPATHEPKADKVKGCILENIGPLAERKEADQTAPPKPKRKRSAKATKEKEVVNLWRDPAPDLLNPKAWCEYSEYLSRAKFRVLHILRARAGLPREDNN